MNLYFATRKKSSNTQKQICICVKKSPIHKYKFVEAKKTDKMEKQKLAKVFIVIALLVYP